MSGSNYGTFIKGKGDVEKIISSGRFSGRSMSYKRGPGVPAKKVRRSHWYEGAPLKSTGKENCTVSTRYSTSLG